MTKYNGKENNNYTRKYRDLMQYKMNNSLVGLNNWLLVFCGDIQGRCQR